jgi:hypothetical protein
VNHTVPFDGGGGGSRLTYVVARGAVGAVEGRGVGWEVGAVGAGEGDSVAG